MNPLRTVPDVDQTIPDITSDLLGLNAMPDELADTIRRLVVDCRKADAMNDTHPNARDEMQALNEMAEALEIAQRKLLTAPSSLRLHYSLGDRKWGPIAQAALDAMSPILAEIKHARRNLEPLLPKRGNPGAQGNQDILTAHVVQILRDADAQDYNARARRILVACGFSCPKGRAFAKAVERGRNLLNGQPDPRSIEGIHRTLTGR